MADPRASARSHPLSSLATKIILFVFGSTLATALVVSWISLRSTHDSLRDTISRYYPISLDQTARRVSGWLAEAQSELDALAIAPARSDAAAIAELDRAVARSRRLAGWVRVDASGQVVGSASITPTAPPSCAPPQSGPRPCSIPVAPNRTLPGLASPGPGGSLWIGVLDTDELDVLLAGSLPEAESTALLLDAQEHVLARTGDAATSAPGAHSSRVPRAPQIAEYDVGGRLMIGSRRDVGEWRVLIETPFEAAFAPVLSVVTRIFVGDLLVILISSLLAYRVTATVVRPIERLSDWARRFATGSEELEVPELSSRDEIGLLARTLTDMRRQLQRRKAELQQANRDLMDRNARLEQANEVLNQLSITDGLTRLHNHRFFQDHLTREIKRVTRSGEPLSMLLTDIDDFKQLNDRFGHAAGDELLTRIAQILVDCVRDSDLVARYGGEEFVVLAINCDLVAAEALAEKLRTAIAESSFILDDSLRPLRVTVSVGVATFRGNRKRFFQRADEALYRAKSQGKNCVVVEEDDEPAWQPRGGDPEDA